MYLAKHTTNHADHLDVVADTVAETDAVAADTDLDTSSWILSLEKYPFSLFLSTTILYDSGLNFEVITEVAVCNFTCKSTLARSSVTLRGCQKVARGKS
jgi:hypothetical protein